jgi:membrane-bound lytic murein transglycosylase A
MCALIVGSLGGCGSSPTLAPVEDRTPAASASPATAAPAAAVAIAPPHVETGQTIVQARSRWVGVGWDALPGLQQDALGQGWRAWIKSCERSATMPPALATLCPQALALANADAAGQRAWMYRHLQPYRVESLQGETQGLLTAYYEPVFEASRTPSANFNAPIYAPPANLASRKPWYTRKEMDTLPEAKAALKGKALVYLNDPVDALVLQIQGSGRIRVQQADGSFRNSRLAFAGTNEQPYKSVGKWLLDQGLTKDASWPGIKAWLARNPQRQQELLWSNPRMVFFREEALSESDVDAGPRGAQGVALSAGRSIAVDPGSIPYGTPVWISSAGPQTQLQQLVIAQDTGSAITGAVRADYFAGFGTQAGDLAGRLKQPLQMWVLWPK